MKIRDYKRKDMEEVIQVWHEASVISHPFISEEKLVLQEYEIRNKYLRMALSYVAEEDGQVVGFISLLDDYIGGLFIKPSKQGLAIGSKLIMKAFEGKEKLTVGVYKKNESAKKFYIKMGFECQSEEVQRETGETVINMIKIRR